MKNVFLRLLLLIFLEVAAGSSEFVDGLKRQIDVTFMGCTLTLVAASYQDEVMTRFLAWAKQQVVSSGQARAFPWEQHFVKEARPVDLADAICSDTCKVKTQFKKYV